MAKIHNKYKESGNTIKTLQELCLQNRQWNTDWMLETINTVANVTLKLKTKRQEINY